MSFILVYGKTVADQIKKEVQEHLKTGARSAGNTYPSRVPLSVF